MREFVQTPGKIKSSFWISAGRETSVNVYEEKAMENATDKTTSILQDFLSWCEKHKIKISPKVRPYTLLLIVNSDKKWSKDRPGFVASPVKAIAYHLQLVGEACADRLNHVL